MLSSYWARSSAMLRSRLLAHLSNMVLSTGMARSLAVVLSCYHDSFMYSGTIKHFDSLFAHGTVIVDG